MHPVLAWIPFVQPAPHAATWWWLLMVPLSLFISMAWKAVRLEKLDGYWRAVLKMSTQIVVGMVALFVALALLVRVIVPMLPVN